MENGLTNGRKSHGEEDDEGMEDLLCYTLENGVKIPKLGVWEVLSVNIIRINSVLYGILLLCTFCNVRFSFRWILLKHVYEQTCIVF
jgi:hypothetical protein